MSVIKHYACSACGTYEDVITSTREGSLFEPTVTCGECGGAMMLVGQEVESEDDDDDDIPYGPIMFLGL